MARLTTIVYECDWCKGRAPAWYPTGEHNGDEPPEGWRGVEYSMLCSGCQKARTEAIDNARHERLNGR